MPGRERSEGGVFHLLYELVRRRKASEEKGEERPKKDPVVEVYKRYCSGKGKVSREIEEAVALLGWDVDPSCIPSAARNVGIAVALGLLFLFPLYLLYLVLFEGLPVADIIPYVAFELSAGNLFLIFLLLLPLIGGFSTYAYLLYYPLGKRDEMLRDILPELPETIGYLVLSMKLTPNLEKALEFAGENGTGRLAEEFKRLSWEVRMGLHTSTEEAVDRLAYRWGKFLAEVKHALMRIRGAVLEPDDARRYVRLDEALRDVMNAVRKRMEDLASKMYMPSVQLFYLGVFLPLLLFIVLPVAAAFTEMPVATLPSLVFIYIILLPLLTYTFARSVLSKRPSLYEPPDPPDILVENYRGIKSRARLYALVAFVVLLGVSYFLHLQLDITYDRAEEMYCGYTGCLKGRYNFTTWEEGLQIPEVRAILSGYDTTPYWLVFGAFLSVVVAISLYLYLTQKPKLDLQRKFIEMEGEFKDVVYLLASRMGEGKPLEGALDAVMEFMPDSLVVREVFSKVSYNIRVLGLSLRDAIFDPLFGALRDVPSRFLRKAMNILVKSVELGTELAAKALLAYSEQLRQEEEIIAAVRSKMSEIRTMMLSMAVLVGPVVLGITVALQQVIISSLMSYQPPEVPEELAYQLGFSMPALGKVEGNVASTTEFLVVVFLYNLILTTLLTYYAVSIHEGRNRTAVLLSLARNLVISSVLFILSAWVSTSLVRGMIG